MTYWMKFSNIAIKLRLTTHPTFPLIPIQYEMAENAFKVIKKYCFTKEILFFGTHRRGFDSIF